MVPMVRPQVWKWRYRERLDYERRWWQRRKFDTVWYGTYTCPRCQRTLVVELVDSVMISPDDIPIVICRSDYHFRELDEIARDLSEATAGFIDRAVAEALGLSGPDEPTDDAG